MSELPAMPRPQGAYVPAVAEPIRTGDVLVASAGMTPRRDGRLTLTGLVGRDLDVPAASEAAGLAARNAVAAVADGDLGRVRRWVRMTVYVACADGFTDLSAVADGASAALDALAPGLGRPARSAVGVRALPGGAPVEVELTAIAGDLERETSEHA
ncbi:RidA family protein [Actinomadura citrea]|uniref:RidA family protein n=1 Tax=Actinomadura TaxID=1988 RepID=UPI002E2CA2A1|nr:RidA family protein [Actinomadura citrea]